MSDTAVLTVKFKIFWNLTNFSGIMMSSFMSSGVNLHPNAIKQCYVWTSMTGGNRGLEPSAVRGHCSQPALTKTLTLPILTYSIFNNISGDHLQSHSVNNIALKSVNSDWSIKHCNIVWFNANCRIRQKFNNGSKWQNLLTQGFVQLQNLLLSQNPWSLWD